MLCPCAQSPCFLSMRMSKSTDGVDQPLAFPLLCWCLSALKFGMFLQMSLAARCSWNWCMDFSIFLLSFSSGAGLLLAFTWDCAAVLLQALSTSPSPRSSIARQPWLQASLSLPVVCAVQTRCFPVVLHVWGLTQQAGLLCQPQHWLCPHPSWECVLTLSCA